MNNNKKKLQSVGTNFYVKEALDLHQVGQFYRPIMKDRDVYLIRPFFHTSIIIMSILYEMGVVSTMDNNIKIIIKKRPTVILGPWSLAPIVHPTNPAMHII